LISEQSRDPDGGSRYISKRERFVRHQQVQAINDVINGFMEIDLGFSELLADKTERSRDDIISHLKDRSRWLPKSDSRKQIIEGIIVSLTEPS